MTKSKPRHVAIIMDGNGRWAHQRSLPRSAGHKQGVEAVRRAVRAALELGIEYLTIYSFSSENWSRPPGEVNYLLDLLRRFIRQDVVDLHAADVRVKVVGDRTSLSADIVTMLDECEHLTRNNKSLNLVVAFNYGGRQELVHAAQQMAAQVSAGQLALDDIDPDEFTRHLYTSGTPDPDLLIRTSGEKRISNFLLWQLAYAEFVFIEEHWPDFNQESFERAIDEYVGRERRFGGLTAKAV
ncbi:MAG: isoprenyl transferase [Rhizobiales bacterium]|nr:isoprenyl transferase [Hyphomicrobiales bacterium]